MKDISQRIRELPPDKLALLLERLDGGALVRPESGPSPIRPLCRGSALRPLSFAQERMWFVDQLQSGGDYNVGGALRLRGKVAITAFEQALHEILRRHEVLRAGFVTLEGQPVQSVEGEFRWLSLLVDLRSCRQPLCEAELERLVRSEAGRPFDLERPPLFRIYWLMLADEDQVLLFTLHHIVCDGWSVEVLIGELVQLYQSFIAGRPSPLPELAVQYADFAQWQREQLQGEKLEQLLGYWRRQLQGASAAIGFRGALPGTSKQGGGGAPEEVFAISAEDSLRLRRVGREELATPFVTLVSLLSLVLHLESGQEDLCLGANAAHRKHLETEGLIGFFINQIVLRVRIHHDETFRGLVRQVRDVTEEAYEHQDLPFEKLVEALCPGRGVGGNPLFQVKVDFQEAREPLRLPGVRLEEIETGSSVLRCDLLLVATGSAEGIACSMTYDPITLGAETVRRLARMLVRITGIVTAEPDLLLSHLSARMAQEVEMLRTAERDRFDRIGATKLKGVRRKGIAI